MYYSDPNDLAYKAQTGLADALGWLQELVDDELEGEQAFEAVDSANAFIAAVSSAMEEYATEMVEVPEAEWGAIDFENLTNHGIRPMRRQLSDPSFEFHANLGQRLWKLHCELDELTKQGLTTSSDWLSAPIATYHCTLRELGAKLKADVDANSPAYVAYDGPDEGPGIDYHPKC